MFKVDIKSSTPIYEQVMSQIKSAVVKGWLKQDDMLPSVRKLSSMLGVNPNTIAKAYNELERQQVIITVRGRGTFVGEVRQAEEKDIKKEIKKLAPVLTELKYKGIDDNVILDEIKELLSEIGGEKND